MITRFGILSSIFGVLLVSSQYNYNSNGYNQNQNQNTNQNNQYQQNTGYGSSSQNNYGNTNTNNNNNMQNSWGSSSNQNGYYNAVVNATTTQSPSTNANGGVTIQFQLKGYSNPNSVLPNSNTCICPTGTCSVLTTTPRCYFSFTFIVSTADESVRYQMSDFVYLENGQLPQSTQATWSQTYVMKLPSKPAAIDVFAHHLGPVITQSGTLVKVEALTHVDTFVIPLLDTLPAVDGVQNMNNQRTYQGKLLGTSLSLSFSVSCAGTLIGPACDLSCTKSTITSTIAQCISNSTGYYSICEYVSNGQVDRCKRCPWGVREGTYCQDANGGVLDPKEAGFVGSGWRTGAIILILIMFIWAILLCVSVAVICFKRRQSTEKEMTTFKQSFDDREPLREPSPQSNGSANRPPMLPPQPIKSSLRKPYTPLSDDSSFASDVPPVRPSRSEVV